MESFKVGDIVWIPPDSYPAIIVKSDPKNCYIKWLYDFGYDYVPITVRPSSLIPYDLDRFINSVMNNDDI